MSINLHAQYAKKILRDFKNRSYIGNRTCKDYKWDGVKTIHVSTPDAIEIGEYKREGQNRFGVAKEIGDTVQSLPIRKDIAYTGTIDKGNANEQQQIKRAGEIMRYQNQNRVVPYMDRYAFNEWAKNAGIVAAKNAPTKSTIIGMILDANAQMTDNLVPLEGRTLYTSAAVVNLIRQSPEWLGAEKLAVKALEKGVVGQICNNLVVEMPSMMLPAGVHFMVIHKESVVYPKKLSSAKVHQDPPGIDGHLIEARQIFDAFVLGQRAVGVYVAADESVVIEAPTIAIASKKATITSSGNVIYYTLDGSDPRYSASAKPYASAVAVEDGMVVRACAKHEDKLNSAVAEKVA